MNTQFQDRALMPGNIDPDVSAALAIYERIKPLKESLGIEALTDAELQVFAYVARFTGLDPFTKQIYAIKRGGRVTHQTGIDGYRSIAERSGEYAGSEEATYELCDCGKDDSPPEHPRVARVVVRRVIGGRVVEQAGVARWHELKPDHFKPQNARDYLDSMWWRQPYNQLAKCAEANGLRKAFPRVLGGVYIAEEMQGPEVVEGEARELPPIVAKPTVAERIAARRAAIESTSTDVPDAAGGLVREPAAEPQAPISPASEEAAAEPPLEADAAGDGADEASSPAPTCGNGSPFGDGGTCGLPIGHKGLHRELGIGGKVVGSWETT